MGYSHTEDLMDALKAFIIANYQTYLTQITTEKADSVPLPMVASDDIILGYMDIDTRKKWPAIFIVPITETWGIDMSLGGESLQAMFQVNIMAGGYRDSWLSEMIIRYASAFRNMLRSDLAIGLTDNTLKQEPDMQVNYYQQVYSQTDLKAARIIFVLTKEVT